MKAAILLPVVLALSAPLPALAWGKVGHGIVAEIAFTLTDSSTRAKITHYLGATTIQQAANWMDEVRSDRRYDYMKPWHYVNIERGAQYEQSKEPDIINRLTATIAALEQKDKLADDEIKKDIMIIFHLTGDLHMPLHVGYATDKGGNDIQVKYLNHQSNLHRVWDTDIIESEGITANQCLMMMPEFTGAEIDALREVNVEEWSRQPRALLGNVYRYNKDDNTIDQRYVDSNKGIIKQQLLIAGIRLAAVLKKIAG